MMKRFIQTLIVSLVVLTVTLMVSVFTAQSSEAKKFEFNCKTMYMVRVPVTVEADSVNKARKMLRRDKEYDYYHHCSFLREVKDPYEGVDNTVIEDEEIEF